MNSRIVLLTLQDKSGRSAAAPCTRFRFPDIHSCDRPHSASRKQGAQWFREPMTCSQQLRIPAQNRHSQRQATVNQKINIISAFSNLGHLGASVLSNYKSTTYIASSSSHVFAPDPNKQRSYGETVPVRKRRSCLLQRKHPCRLGQWTCGLLPHVSLLGADL